MGKREEMKYGNKKIQVGSLVFDSKAEYSRWRELLLLARSGRIQNLHRQNRFELIPKQDGERAVNYTADFTYVENGKFIVEDVKSAATKRDKAYIIKRKLFKYTHGDVYTFREVEQ